MPFESRKSVVLCAVLIALILGAQLQHFAQAYRDETQAAKAGESNSSPSGKEYIGDFQVYYTAALIARRAGDHRLYYPPSNPQLLMIENVPADTGWAQAAKSAGLNGTMHFIYPPFAALVLSPVSVFRWPVALLLWRVAMTAALLLSVFLAVRLAGTKDLWTGFGIAALAASAFFPVSEALMEGQIDSLILLLWVGGIYLAAQRHSFWSALLFAAGTAIKLSPGIAVFWFLVRRQWKWLFSYAGCFLTLQAISVWRLGWQNQALFLRKVLPRLGCGIASLANRSIGGLLYDAYLRRVPLGLEPSIPNWMCWIMKAVGAVLLVFVLIRLARKIPGNSPVPQLITLALLSLLISPVSWRHHYVLALLPLIYLWRVVEEGKDVYVVAIASLVMGTVLFDYAIAAVRNPLLDIGAAALMPASALALLWITLRQPTGATATA